MSVIRLILSPRGNPWILVKTADDPFQTGIFNMNFCFYEQTLDEAFWSDLTTVALCKRL